jgi:hypothetical protein
VTEPPALIQEILENGEIEIKGQFTRGSNYTFLVEVRFENGNVLAVYKPERGEQTLWDFPENSLAGREVSAYLISQAMGLGIVPLTLLREGPLGLGSLQQYIDHNPNYHYFSFKPDDMERLRSVALFDLVINNADRKGSHILIQKRTRKLYLIDHGVCFHAEDKLRTVIWDFAGEPIPDNLLASLSKFQSLLNETGNLNLLLSQYLTQEELASLQQRTIALLSSKHFPYPPEDRRAFPYPPI